VELKVLSGGAAQGLVGALASQFEAEKTGCTIAGTFGAVGAMRDRLVAGAPADLLILTSALIAELERAGHVVAGSAVGIGLVRTGVAVRGGDPIPSIGDAEALRASLLAADAVYFPDPKLATAGIHFARVLDRLGIAGELASRLKPFPNGASAMRELAAASGARPIGCTQVTEILAAPGVALVGPLPEGFELATVYTAAVAARATLPDAARRLAALLAGDAASHVRRRLGFEPPRS
jgi:molybdate transport system substrate-binding protein